MADVGLVVTAATGTDATGVIARIGRIFAEYGFVYDPAVEVPGLFRFEHHYAPPRSAFFVARNEGLIVGSVGVERLEADTAELHRLYTRMGSLHPGERDLPDDVNGTREHGFERTV